MLEIVRFYNIVNGYLKIILIEEFLSIYFIFLNYVYVVK